MILNLYLEYLIIIFFNIFIIFLILVDLQPQYIQCLFPGRFTHPTRGHALVWSSQVTLAGRRGGP